MAMDRWAWYKDASGKPRDWYCEDALSGRLEIRRVFEDERVLAFHHRDPSAPVHVVIAPKAHVPSILDPSAGEGALLSSMVRAIQEVARALGLEGKGLQVIVNAGPRHTPHMHWHVMGPGTVTWPPAREPRGGETTTRR